MFLVESLLLWSEWVESEESWDLKRGPGSFILGVAGEFLVFLLVSPFWGVEEKEMRSDL